MCAYVRTGDCRGQKDGVRFSETGVTCGCELSYVGAGKCSGPLQEQYMLLNAMLSVKLLCFFL